MNSGSTQPADFGSLLLLNDVERRSLGEIEAGLRRWRTYRWCALATSLLAVATAYRLIATISKDAIATGTVRPALVTVVVPASWVLLAFGGCLFAYTLVRWKGDRQQRIFVALVRRLEKRLTGATDPGDVGSDSSHTGGQAQGEGITRL